MSSSTSSVQSSPALMTEDDVLEDSNPYINNESCISTVVSDLYTRQLLCDVTLNVGGTIFQAHKLILCAHSDVFQAMLLDKRWTEAAQSVITLHEEQECVKVFEDFLQFMYTGKVKRDSFIILPLLELADKYNVKGLTSICLKFMTEHQLYATANGLILPWFQYCLNANHTQVSKCCKDSITHNFEMLSKRPEFYDLECASLVVLLQSSEIVIENELRLYK